MRRNLFALLVLAAISAAVFHVPAPAAGRVPVAVKLSPELLAVLREEMRLIEKAVHTLIDANTRGETKEVAAQARAIHRNFILKQRLSEEQKQELRDSLPAEFFEIDRGFHNLALELARAAEARQAEEMGLLIGRMLGRCAECHGKYATNRFPSFEHGGLTIPDGETPAR